MADTIRRVYEIDAKLSTDALASLRAIQANLKAVEDQAAKTGKASKKLGHEAEEGAHGFDKLNFSSVGARRELLVLVHELSQGNYKQFGGSLLVLGERIDATSLIMSRAGLATIGFAGVLVGLTIAAVKGAIEQDHFNKSLLLTGNYAGQTASSYTQLADALQKATGQSIGASREVLQQLISTGQFGPRLLKPAAEAALQLSRVTGETTEDIVKDFAKMGDGVLKYADEHNKQYHFITLAQHDYIRALEETGQTEKAQQFVLEKLTEHLGGPHAQNLGLVARAWHAVGNAVSSAIEAIKDFGRESDIATKIATIQASIKSAEAIGPAGFVNASQRLSKPSESDQKKYDEYLAAQRAQLAAFNRALLNESSTASEKAFEAYIQEEGIKGDNILRSIQKQIRNGNKADEVINEYRAALAKARAANKSDKDIFGTSSQAQDEALIRAHFGAKVTVDKDANAVEKRLQAYAEEDAAIKDQIRQYQELGKAVDKSVLAKLDADIASGRLKPKTNDETARLRAAAEQIDQDQAQKRALEAGITADKRIVSLKNEAEAHAINSREKKTAVELDKLETDGLVKGTPAYEERAAKIKLYTNAIADNALAVKLLADISSAFNESAKLQDEISLIGASTLERQKHAAVLKVQAEARKLLLVNPDKEAEIYAAAALQLKLLVTGLDAAYYAQRTFEAGAKEAFASYAESAGNAATFASSVITGGLQQMEDAFVQLYATGKFNLGNLFDYMKTEFIKQAAKITVNSIFGDKGIQGFVTDGLKSLGGMLGLKTSGGDLAAQSAQQQQSAALAESAITIKAMNLASSEGTSALARLGLAANAAASALSQVSVSAGGSGIGGWASVFDTGGASYTTGSFSAASTYAKGGIMGPHGNIPLNSYAGGGIARGPQMALIGEGRRHEAYVPLPDNRSIPVTLSGNSGGDSGTVVNIYNNGSGDEVTQKTSTGNNGQKNIDIYIEKKVRDTVRGDISSGGSIAKQLEGQYGLNRSYGAPK